MGDISTAYVQQYGKNVDLLAQQKGSKLTNCVRIKPGVIGKTTYMDQLGATTAQKKTTRNADTPLIKSDHQRRRITMYDWEWADLLDKNDELKILIDPTSDYVVNASFALGRSRDEELLDRAEGTAYSGEEGATQVALPTTQKITSTGGLTIAKLLDAKTILDNNDVDDEERYISITGTQLNDLLNTTQVTSADYNTVKALVEGKIDTFCGFKFKLCSQSVVNISGSSRHVMAWAKSGLGLAIAKEMTHRITERADKSYATQVYSCMGIGATRLEEKKVVQINCKE